MREAGRRRSRADAQQRPPELAIDVGTVLAGRSACDPERLLADLAAAAEANGIESRPCVLVGIAVEPGKEEWRVVPAP